MSSIFYSISSNFYTEKSHFDFLSATFKKNMNLLKNSLESQDLPSFSQNEEFFLDSFSFQNSSITMKQYFNWGKLHLIWLFSVYEIWTQNHSFIYFVNFNKIYFFILIFLFFSVKRNLEKHRCLPSVFGH